MAWTGGSGHRFENAALAVLALIVASIATYAVLTRPDTGSTAGVDLGRVMPDDYKPILSALIRATGQECDVVCSASVADPALGVRHVRAACSIEARHVTCAQARAFEIEIAPAPEPSR